MMVFRAYWHFWKST